MIRVRTGSRLHFGLLSVPSARDPGQRTFGGVGLMIDKPGIELSVEAALAWSAEGPLAERAQLFARDYCTKVGIEDAFTIRVKSASPEHAGLGTGTQLGLAAARAIAELTQQSARDAITLAHAIGRGQRSAIGIHGFDQGGFIVEGGKSSSAAISPLLVHEAFPANWRILLITPRDLIGVHGARERDAFAELTKQPPDDRTTETLCRLVLLGMLPALGERDLPAFGDALYEFNRRSGSMFKAAQGGLYAHPRIEAIVTSLRELGIHGVGQSSWGPTVFAIIAADEVAHVRARLPAGMAEQAECVVAASQGGVEVSGDG